MIFKSRYDTWLRIVLWITNLMLFASLFVLLAEPRLGTILVALFAATVLAGVIWMQFATYYRIDEEHLFVRCGPLHWLIPIDAISSVTPTDDPTSGPALSLQRLRLEFTKSGRKQELMISPEDREGFIDALRNAGNAAALRKTSHATTVPPPA